MFSDGLQRWMLGGKGESAEAAGINLAQILTICANYATDNKWSPS